jgi:hypothetical protein
MPLVRSLVLGVLAAVALVPATPHEPAPAITPANCCVNHTVQIGTNGSPSGPTQIVYTCFAAASVPGSPVCGPEIVPQGRWTRTLTVPVGAQVWINASSTQPDASGSAPDCWISDQSGSQVYIKNDRGDCVYQDVAPPSPPGPPSS